MFKINKGTFHNENKTQCMTNIHIPYIATWFNSNTDLNKV